MPSRQQVASWMLLIYLAISLSVLISKQTARIATKETHNPHLFTAHYSAERYLSLEDPFKPRLFAFLLVAPFIELDQKSSLPSSPGRISAAAFERLVAGWSFVWFLAVLLLYLGTARPLLYMFGTTAGVSFAYSLQAMVFPYDLPALFFSTLILLLSVRAKAAWLPLALGLGTGFKETIVVFSFLTLFLEGPRKQRLRALAICLLVCFAVLTAIDLYSQRDFLGFEAVTSAEDSEDASRPKLFLNPRIALDPSSLVLFANAGLALPLFLLPAGGDRLARGFRCIAILFAGGLFLLAQVNELRIWFELIPLCLYNVTSFLDRSRTRQGASADG